MTENASDREGKSTRLERWWAVGPIGFGVILILLFIWNGNAAREASSLATCSARLRELGFFFHMYHEKTGRFPMAVIRDKDGSPMHSWRTELLRVVYPQDVNEYRFDEPWDSQHNLDFAQNNMPNFYHCPGSTDGAFTSYALLIGPGCLYSDDRAEPTKLDIANEAALLVEIPDGSILWTEPRDVECGFTTDQTFKVHGGQSARLTIEPSGGTKADRHSDGG